MSDKYPIATSFRERVERKAAVMRAQIKEFERTMSGLDTARDRAIKSELLKLWYGLALLEELLETK